MGNQQDGGSKSHELNLSRPQIKPYVPGGNAGEQDFQGYDQKDVSNDTGPRAQRPSVEFGGGRGSLYSSQNLIEKHNFDENAFLYITNMSV